MNKDIVRIKEYIESHYAGEYAQGYVEELVALDGRFAEGYFDMSDEEIAEDFQLYVDNRNVDG
jgi:hypothetical protein